MRQKTVLIVGGSGGIGQALVRKYLAEGWLVKSLDLRDNPLTDAHLASLVCSAADGLAMEKARESFLAGPIDVVIYAAGLLSMCSLIEEPVETSRRIMEVNLFGMMQTVKTYSEDVIAAQGRFVLFSSEVGRSSSHPFNGPYSISKHAVEAYADSLRREVGLLGVQVVKIECGGVNTPLLSKTLDSFDRLVDGTTHYRGNLAKMRRFLEKSMLKGCDPDYLAARVYKASVCRKPRIGYRIKNSALIRLADLFGMRVGDWLFLMILKERRHDA